MIIKWRRSLMVKHHIANVNTVGSVPIVSSIYRCSSLRLEHNATNVEVEGAIPSSGTKYFLS